MISGLIQAFSAAGLCTTRAFLPAFLVSLGIRVSLDDPILHDTQFGLLADVMHAQAPWFTSNAFMTIVGALAVLEFLSTKSPDIRDLLRQFDIAIKPVMAAVTTLGIVSSTDIETINATLEVHQASMLGMLILPILSAGATLGGTWFRTELHDMIESIDSDDSLGLLKVISWGEEVWVSIGVFLMFILPLMLLVLIGLIFLILGIVERVMEGRIRTLERPCHQCTHATHPSAVYCSNCHALQPDPVDISYFGMPKIGVPANPEDHRFRLLRSRRCPSCASKMASRSATEPCEQCGDTPIGSQAHAQAYADWNSKSEKKVLIICFVLGLIPVVGVIPAAVYYRIALVSPYRRYMPRWRSIGVKITARVSSFLLFMFQWLPVIGWISLPAMAFINHRMYRKSFLSSCRAGLVAKQRPPLVLPPWLARLRDMMPQVRVQGWQIGAAILLMALVFGLWPADSQAAERVGYGRQECPDLDYRISGTWTSGKFTETFGQNGSYRIVMRNPIGDGDEILVDASGQHALNGESLSLHLSDVHRQYRAVLTQGDHLLYVAPSGVVSTYSRATDESRIPAQCAWTNDAASGRWMVGDGNRELVVEAQRVALVTQEGTRTGRISWSAAGEGLIRFDDGRTSRAYFGVMKHQVVLMSESESELSRWIQIGNGALMQPSDEVRAEIAANAAFQADIQAPDTRTTAATRLPRSGTYGGGAALPAGQVRERGVTTEVAQASPGLQLRLPPEIAPVAMRWARLTPNELSNVRFVRGQGGWSVVAPPGTDPSQFGQLVSRGASVPEAAAWPPTGGVRPMRVQTRVRVNIHANSDLHSQIVHVAPRGGLLVALVGAVDGHDSAMEGDDSVVYVVGSSELVGWTKAHFMHTYANCVPEPTTLGRLAVERDGGTLREEPVTSRTAMYVHGRRRDVFIQSAVSRHSEQSYMGVFDVEGSCQLGRQFGFYAFEGVLDEYFVTDTARSRGETLLLAGSREVGGRDADGTVDWRAFELENEEPVWQAQLPTAAFLNRRQRASIGGSRDRILRNQPGFVLGVRRRGSPLQLFTWSGGTLVLDSRSF